MGILNKLFQTKKSFPELEQSSPHARRLERMQDPLNKLVAETPDDIEVLPSENMAFLWLWGFVALGSGHTM